MYRIANKFIGSGGKSFIDYYNKNIRPLPRGYKLKYHDSWCACYVSCILHMYGYRNSNYFECSCQHMFNNLIKLGYKSSKTNVQVNDIVFYDWGNGGYLDHVGIVTGVNGNYITVTEGNKNNKVDTRYININSKYIVYIVHMGICRGSKGDSHTNTSIPYEKLSNEVIQGVYGNGIDVRYNNIKKHYKNFTMQDMKKVQDIVNRKLM